MKCNGEIVSSRLVSTLSSCASIPGIVVRMYDVFSNEYYEFVS